eukprot:scaffold439_cov415-Prasinococcus_capsulatus_cf.AAC.2
MVELGVSHMRRVTSTPSIENRTPSKGWYSPFHVRRGAGTARLARRPVPLVALLLRHDAAILYR